MAIRDLDYDDDDDESDDWEEDDEDDTLMPCPHCLGSVYDDAEQCPRCGMYLSREDAPYSKPLWLLLGVAICLIVVARWILLL